MHVQKILKFWQGSRGHYRDIVIETWHDDAVLPSWPFLALKIWNFRNPKWRQKNRKIVIPQPRLARFRRNLLQWPVRTSWPSRPLNIWKFKKPKMAAAATAILNNRKIAISRPRFDRFCQNVAGWRSLTFLTFLTVKV